MLTVLDERHVTDPVYLEKDFRTDDALIEQVRAALIVRREGSIAIDDVRLGNSDKSVGGQLSIDIERMLNHQLDPALLGDLPSVIVDDRGRARFADGTVRISTQGTAGQSYGAFCNDGVVLVHTGTANDGVSKSQSGGTVIVRSPGGGAADAGANVLIGNFAAFGATGGRLFVSGEAGDRFAVRNSGISAVVEGVGDFACEYMTNGAVLNLGSFGKGLGNGMSGGFVYQYDPEGLLAGRHSADSLLVRPLVGDPHGAFHESAVLLLLRWHLDATGSALAERLLEDWDLTRTKMFFGMPRALLLSQDADAVLAQRSRKELLDELASQVSSAKLRDFKQDYRDHRVMMEGRAPAQGGDDMYRLLSSYTVLSIAQSIARDRVPAAASADDPEVAEVARKLILTEDFFVMQKVNAYLRGTLERFDDLELATLIAAGRLEDYKRSLTMRNVRGIDAPGTYGWILHQNAKNSERIRSAHFDQLLTTAALGDLAALAREAVVS